MVVEVLPRCGGTVPTVCSGSRDDSDSQASGLSFDLPAVGTIVWTFSSREDICIDVLAPLTMFGCEVALLEMLNPAGCLSFQIIETQ